ncbi:hypothetical protein EVAR_54363_1 [Eumeta japonica]|uniref:Uncharacterized protein n=1 Tax=Eumeta variegata TaxID=151549 RepID=A0A4C1Z410_EUMVA|nr:hypothetical protein EVAR_54363_1 [Eumeta japonica]
MCKENYKGSYVAAVHCLLHVMSSISTRVAARDSRQVTRNRSSALCERVPKSYLSIYSSSLGAERRVPGGGGPRGRPAACRSNRLSSGLYQLYLRGRRYQPSGEFRRLPLLSNFAPDVPPFLRALFI